MERQVNRRFSMVWIVFVLVITLSLGPDLAHANIASDGGGETAMVDSYDKARINWYNKLTGNEQFDPNNPDMDNYISKLNKRISNAENTGYWDTMNKSGERTYLWESLASTTNSSDITNSYSRLKDMALAYSMVGSSFYQNEALRDDIIAALDWMYTNRYNEGENEYGNWWDWEIGAPQKLNDVLVLMYDELTSILLNNYMEAIDRFVPDPNVRLNGVKETGANLLDKVFVVSLRGVIGKNSDKITLGSGSMAQEYLYVDHGDGVYRDGSLVQHTNIAYTGGYGAVWLSRTADMLFLLKGSPWEITDPKVNNVFNWVTDTFEPVIYKGAMMDMVSGRGMSRQGSDDHAKGRSTILSLLSLADAAPPEKEMMIKRMVKEWIQTDTTFENYTEGLGIYQIDLVHSLMNNSSIEPRGELIKNQVFAGMDRVVHLRPEFGLGISMFSDRISAFEYGNGENSKGWYTGIGMTYLYNNDLRQFSNDYWPTVDSYRLPGTTTDGSKGTLKEWGSYYNPRNWVGGSSIDGLYGVAGMDFSLKKVTGSTLQGKKSWFMFDDEIVALGSDITSSDNRKVETIVENRQLRDAGDNELIIDGETKSNRLGWSETVENVDWAHLEGNVKNASIGYYFPDSTNVFGLREKRTGSWDEINNSGPTESISRNYLSLALNHGSDPTDASYSYVLLPNKNADATKSYSNSPNVSILSNTAKVHAVKEKTLGLTGANFWEAGEVDFIRSLQPASVMVKEDGDVLTLSVSDPTQKQDHVIVELGKIGTSVISKDDSVTVLQTKPYIKVAIDVKNALGKSHTIKFNKSNGGKLPPTGKIEMDGAKEISQGEQASLGVKVTNNGERVLPAGKLNLSVPNGWRADPKSIAVPELRPNESHKVTIEITVPEAANYGHHEIGATFKAGNTIRKGSYSVKVIPSIGPPQNARGYEVGSVKASAVPQNENAPENTIGDLNTRWSAQGEQWIRYNLSGVKEIKHVSIAFHEGDARSGLFDIQTSIDGENWTTVFSGESSGTTKKLETYTFNTFQAKYIRIFGHGNTSSNWNSITEVNIYGSSLNSAADIKKVVERFKESGEFANDVDTRILQTHLTAVAHFEEKGSQEKVVKHLKGFKVLLANQKENKLITEKAYSILEADTDYLIDKWQ